MWLVSLSALIFLVDLGVVSIRAKSEKTSSEEGSFLVNNTY
jgi:hypothetical protein